MENLAKMKLTAEKLVEEQASLRSDLEIAITKLKNSIDHICALEEILCDECTTILQLLVGQAQNAEKDKEAFERKLYASEVAVDGLKQHINDLSIKLESAEETIQNRERKLEERRLEKEETDKFYRNEQCRTLKEKDVMIKNFEETLESNGLATETLNTKTGEVHLEMKSTENDIRRLIIVQENLTSEKDAIQFVNQKLNSKVIELKKVQESVMAQHARECSLARERIHELECEAEGQVSNEIETEKVCKLELQMNSLSESSKLSEIEMKDQLRKISALETKSKDNTEKIHAEIWKKAEQIDGLLKEGETDEQHVELMDKQVRHLYKTLEEKEQLTPQYKEQEKNLEEQITEIPDHLVAKIISRVPSKNIQRCHILSHEFNNSHLHGPFFLQSQLDLKKNCKDILITAWHFGLPSVDNFSSIRAPFQQHFYGIHLDKPEEMPTRYQCSHLLTLPVSPTLHYEISGSVHGLICLQRSSSLATEPNCLIYNPGSKIVTVIPASVSSLSEVGVQVDLGYYLGFNASSSTYKVLNIKWLWGASNTLTGVLFRIFEFGDATNDVIPRWKAIEVNLETLPFDFIGCSQHFKLQKSILVGSTLHWMIRDLGIIPTFSLNDEAFQGVINLPPGPPPIYGDILTLMDRLVLFP